MRQRILKEKKKKGRKGRPHTTGSFYHAVVTAVLFEFSVLVFGGKL